MAQPFIRPGLGRRFGQLMEEARPRPSDAEPGLTAPPLTPGVEALLKGSARTSETPRIQTSADGPSEGTRMEKTQDQARTLRWTLIAADAVLLILASWLVFGSSQPAKPATLLLAALAIVMGGWLACLAVLHR